MNNRNYNEELKNTADRKYAYNFDFDVMHPYMIESFKPFFKGDDVLELGSSVQSCLCLPSLWGH